MIRQGLYVDWYLHYNYHCSHWNNQLLKLTKTAQTVLRKSYDRQKIMSLFNKYPYLDPPSNRKITHDLRYQRLRCLSMAFYLS